MIPRVSVVVLAMTVILPITRTDGQGPPVPFEFPNTLAGKRMQGWFEAHAAGSDDKIREFQQRHRPAGQRQLESRIESAKSFRKTWGKLTPRLVLYSGAQERLLNVLAENTDEKKWYRCELLLEKTEPFWFRGVALHPVTGPELCIQSHTAKTLTEAVRRFQQAAGVPALAIGVIRGEEIETVVAGVRRLGTDDAVTMSDRFHVGSITKSMTAMVFGRLVEQELVQWNSTLGKLLPDIQMRPEYREVTLEELLQHRAGLPRFASVDDFRKLTIGSEPDERSAFSAAALNLEPAVIPRKKFQYSNAGYGIAGHIAECVTGKTWEELIAAEVFQPAGMTNSGFGWPATAERRNQPSGHRTSDDGSLRIEELDTPAMAKASAPAGDIHCSIGDLARYARFHLRALNGQDGSLRPITVKRLHTPLPGGPTGYSYAGGWYIQNLRFRKRHTHGGSGGSFLAVVVLEPESNIAVVIAANARKVTELNTIADSLLDWLRPA